MKYIVYLTINTVTNKFYIGIRKTEDPDVFDGYLGDGVNCKYPSTIKHPKTHFQNSVKTYGFSAFRRYTLKVVDTYEEALLYESLLVDTDFTQRDDTYNMAIGGGSPILYEVAINMFDLDGNFLKNYASIKEAAYQNNICDSGIITALKTKKSYNDCFWSKDATIDVNLFRRTLGKKTVYEYTITGELTNSYVSLIQAAKSIEVTPEKLKNAISKQLAINKRYYSYNDKFYIKVDINRAVYQYTLTGEYVQTKPFGMFVTEDSIDPDKLHFAANSGLTLKGFQWNYAYVSKMHDLTSRTNESNCRKVKQLDLDGNVIKVWDSVKDCKKHYGNVSRVLNGKQSQTKGYVFRYFSN